MNGKEKERKVSFKLSTFFIWYWVACKHFFFSWYICWQSLPFFCALNYLFFFLLPHNIAFPLLIQKISRGKKISRVHILRKESQRKMDQPSIHPCGHLSINPSRSPPASIKINSRPCTHCWLAEVVIWTKGLFGKRMLKL